ncbi:MAG TPA: hypothetical protein VKE70_03005 [Candidatus Solibacter sp.]|nr:hypothetical protein [Candidatus Solibacter sp.]
MQAALVVPPITVLSAVAFFSLRQDRPAVLQDARDLAGPAAKDTAVRLGMRVSQLLAAEPAMQGVITGGLVQSPW